MRHQRAYSPSEWEAYAKGESLAETKVALKLPAGLTSAEQTAFREGYQTRCEDIRNRPVVDAIKRMVSPLPIKRLFLSLAHHD
jgi:hypothetical protein